MWGRLHVCHVEDTYTFQCFHTGLRNLSLFLFSARIQARDAAAFGPPVSSMTALISVGLRERNGFFHRAHEARPDECA